MPAKPRSSRSLFISPSVEERLLLEKYTPLVRRIAYSMQNASPFALESADSFQDGMIGLLRAIRSNRPGTTEAQFTAYARTSIRGAIIDGYRASGTHSRHEYDQAKRVRQAAAEGEAIRDEHLRHAEVVMSQAWTPAIPVDGSNDGHCPIADPAPGPEQRVAANQLLRKAVDAIQSASVRDRTIFISCELGGERQSAVAKRYGLSVGRVSQIIRQVRQDVLAAIA